MTDSEDFKFYYQRGREKSSAEDLKGAIEDYTKAIEINPNNDEVYWDRGYERFQLKDYQGSIDDMSKGIELASDDNENVKRYFHLQRAKARELSNQYQEAIEDYVRATELGGMYYTEIGKLKYKLNNLEGAIDSFNKSIEETSGSSDFYGPPIEDYYGLGIAKYDLQDYKGAIDDYMQAIKYIPTEVADESEWPEVEKYYLKLGKAYAKTNDLQLAIKAWEKAAELGDDEARESIENHRTNT